MRMRVGPGWLLVSCVLGCGGAEEEAERPALGQPCETTDECREGLVCDTNDDPTASMCSESCTSSEECEAAYGPFAFCIGAERCVLGCRADVDCEADQFCNDARWCQRATCRGNDDCWAYRCNIVEAECLDSCNTDSECNEGWECAEEYDSCIPRLYY